MTIVQEILSVGGYKIIDNFLSRDKWVRPGTRITPSGGVIHWTANLSQGADDRANRNFFENRVNSYGSAHTIGDQDSIIGALPYMPKDAEMGYHVGADRYYVKTLGSYPNSHTLGHEMCVNKGANFRESYKRAVWIMAFWSSIYDWNPQKNIYRHWDITKKDCPLPFVDLILDDHHCRGKGWSDSDIKWMRENLHIDGVQGEKLWVKYKNDVSELVEHMINGMFVEIESEDECEVDKLAQWQIDMGTKAIDELAKDGLIANPEDWKGDKLAEHVPNWLFFELLKRIAEKK